MGENGRTKLIVSRRSSCALTFFVKLSFLPKVTVAGRGDNVCPLWDLSSPDSSSSSAISLR
jgi:hypothetical protein